MLVLYTIHIHKGVFVTASEVQCTLFLVEVSRKLALKDAFWSSTVRVYTIMHAPRTCLQDLKKYTASLKNTCSSTSVTIMLD